MSETAFGDRRWTRKEYGHLIELGVLGDDTPVELIEGRMIIAEPQNSPHAVALELVADALRKTFGRGWRLRVQIPLGLDPDSEPEPDIVVLRGAPRDSLSDHPSTADLVVEVHRAPRGGRSPRYADVRTARAGDTISPLAAPDARIEVDDLLP